MTYEPLPPDQSVAFVLGFYAWAALRLWLGLRFRQREDWSSGLDGFAFGLVVAAAVVLVGRVVHV